MSKTSYHQVTFIDQISKGRIPLEKVFLVESQKEYNSRTWNELTEFEKDDKNGKKKAVITCSCSC